MSSGNSKYRNSKIKNFLFFLGVAIVIWLLTKFSKETAATLTVGITYEQLPNNTLLSDKNQEEISFDVTSNGFQVLFHSVKKPILEIPLMDFYKEGDSIIQIPETSLSKLVERQLSIYNARNFTNNELKVFLDRTISKKLPVKATLNLHYKEGFRAIDSAQMKPDSVLLYGPSEFIKEITYIPTQEITKKELQGNFTEDVALLEFENPKIKVVPKKVTVSFEVKEFSQKQVTVPIELLNVPSNTSLKISGSDFRVVCDFSEKVSEGNFMIPKILNQPKGIYRVELSPRKIEYLIFK